VASASAQFYFNMAVKTATAEKVHCQDIGSMLKVSPNTKQEKKNNKK
jgi:hypothetical protein